LLTPGNSFRESQQGQRVRERLQSSGLVVERRRRIQLRRPTCFVKYVAPPLFKVNNIITTNFQNKIVHENNTANGLRTDSGRRREESGFDVCLFLFIFFFTYQPSAKEIFYMWTFFPRLAPETEKIKPYLYYT